MKKLQQRLNDFYQAKQAIHNQLYKIPCIRLSGRYMLLFKKTCTKMIEKFKYHVPFEKFIKDCYSYEANKQTYDISYPEFLEYFKNIEVISRHNLIIGINFTYGWM
ncbi:MAG: hypothetical protein WCP32_12315, partial [Bacteroidota bacterium]